MPKIFISHAYEDKAAIADALAHALLPHYDVWYDQFELTAGDSLLSKINEGLATCDYGVVILSPAFFKKKWTRAELDGLMAVEDAKRKVILPIWLNINEDELKKLSPTLAGRLGIDGSLPTARIVEEIRRAVEVAERVSSFASESRPFDRLKQIARQENGYKEAEKLTYSEEGVALLKQEVDQLRSSIRKHILDLGDASRAPTFTAEFSRHGTLEVRGPYGCFLAVQFFPGNIGSITGAQLRYIISTDTYESEGYLHDERLRPSFNHEGRLVWTDSGDECMSTHQLHELMVDRYVDSIEQAGNDHRRSRKDTSGWQF